MMIQDGNQAIHLATRKGHLEIVQYLLEDKGVSPRVPLKVCAVTNVVYCKGYANDNLKVWLIA